MFDYIFFIGSINVGKIVMIVVVKYLVFVIFEFGGKSLMIIDSEYDFMDVVKKIVVGKFVNVG